jgi:hypothetical protein
MPPQAIKQVVTVRTDGIVEVRSPQLHEGDRAEVTVVVVQPASEGKRANGDTAKWRRFAGAVKGASVRGGDNAGIDADLASEAFPRGNSGTQR